MFYAHSGTPDDKSDWQPLTDHLVAVAELAAEMAAPLGLEKAAALAGLLHDLGKYTPEFQRRLTGADVRVDHSTAGAALLLGDLAKGLDKGVAELVARGGVDRNIDEEAPEPGPGRRPFAGAWIETPMIRLKACTRSVAPSRGRGSKPLTPAV